MKKFIVYGNIWQLLPMLPHILQTLTNQKPPTLEPEDEIISQAVAGVDLDAEDRKLDSLQARICRVPPPDYRSLFR